MAQTLKEEGKFGFSFSVGKAWGSHTICSGFSCSKRRPWFSSQELLTVLEAEFFFDAEKVYFWNVSLELFSFVCLKLLNNSYTALVLCGNSFCNCIRTSEVRMVEWIISAQNRPGPHVYFPGKMALKFTIWRDGWGGREHASVHAQIIIRYWIQISS